MGTFRKIEGGASGGNCKVLALLTRGAIGQLLSFDQYGVHASQITTWKDQLLAGAANVFGPGGTVPAAPAADPKAPHAKIGKLTLEGDF